MQGGVTDLPAGEDDATVLDDHVRGLVALVFGVDDSTGAQHQHGRGLRESRGRVNARGVGRSGDGLGIGAHR